MSLISKSDDYLDLSKLSDNELYQIMREAKNLYEAASAEVNRWGMVRCVVCQKEDIAYRDAPFYGWTTSSGYLLCQSCTLKWECKYGGELSGMPIDNPVDEIMAILD